MSNVNFFTALIQINSYWNWVLFPRLSRTDAYNFKIPGQGQASNFEWQRGTFLNGTIDSTAALCWLWRKNLQVYKGPTWG